MRPFAVDSKPNCLLINIIRKGMDEKIEEDEKKCAKDRTTNIKIASKMS